ncbi:uncharacterized protein LOC122062133 [Macadamia integrifolia]|uniref:uncharacterized protein LOC122062133 n=1 Tax=Macadamia integrifolia TaxID=60698 RepID=UPI001C52D02B|nr:uncharacterized protein LOC122062133 [Macadamia integrifolia]
MGQALKSLAAGEDEKKAKEIGPIIDECYNRLFSDPSKFQNMDAFYHAICETIEEINKRLGNTQFHVPSTETFKEAFNKHHQTKDKDGNPKPLDKEEFGNILQAVIRDTGVTGVGAKDILFYIFGVPTTALVIKNSLIPSVLPNELFIPGITSATVFLLAKLGKI